MQLGALFGNTGTPITGIDEEIRILEGFDPASIYGMIKVHDSRVGSPLVVFPEEALNYLNMINTQGLEKLIRGQHKVSRGPIDIIMHHELSLELGYVYTLNGQQRHSAPTRKIRIQYNIAELSREEAA